MLVWLVPSKSECTHSSMSVLLIIHHQSPAHRRCRVKTSSPLVVSLRYCLPRSLRYVSVVKLKAISSISPYPGAYLTLYGQEDGRLNNNKVMAIIGSPAEH